MMLFVLRGTGRKGDYPGVCYQQATLVAYIEVVPEKKERKTDQLLS